jgi:radical SAM protein with 4Fe4S-binding SPASM domain
VRGIRMLQAHHLPVSVKTVLTSVQMRDIKGIIGLAKTLGCEGIPEYGSVGDTLLWPRRDGSSLPQACVLTTQQLSRYLIDYESRDPSPPDPPGQAPYVCPTGRNQLAIGPNGDVHPCLSWPAIVLGNVRRHSLRWIWHESHRIKALRAEMAAVDDWACRDCPLGSTCQPCPAYVARENGHMNALPSEQCRQAKLRTDIRGLAMGPPRPR